MLAKRSSVQSVSRKVIIQQGIERLDAIRRPVAHRDHGDDAEQQRQAIDMLAGEGDR